MENYDIQGQAFKEDGFTIINNVFSPYEVVEILNLIEMTSSETTSFRKSKDLFAIRRLLVEIPELTRLIFTDRLFKIINKLFDERYFMVKAIYFDKPPESNWFVAYHQDITIAVNQKVELEGYNSWTIKQDQFAVQPPTKILESNFTVRIHLDDTTSENGALKVIRASHKQGVLRPETLDRACADEVTCEVEKGGVMLMRPLLFHASGKTTNSSMRRVIHMEFSNTILPHPLQWSEYLNRNSKI